MIPLSKNNTYLSTQEVYFPVFKDISLPLEHTWSSDTQYILYFTLKVLYMRQDACVLNRSLLPFTLSQHKACRDNQLHAKELIEEKRFCSGIFFSLLEVFGKVSLLDQIPLTRVQKEGRTSCR